MYRIGGGSTFQYARITKGGAAVPRTIDRAARQRDIAVAVLRLVEARGLAAATVREVAAEAGVSVGAVQRSFPTRERMLRAALERINERFTARVRDRVAAAGIPLPPRAGCRLLIREMLPFNEAGRADARVALAFLGVAAVDEAAREVIGRGYAGVIDFFTRQLTALREAGELRTGVDPAPAAVGLYALIEGLRTPVLLDQLTEEQAMAAVDDDLDRLFR
jgi:AcrR family transcriptional regulator